MSWLAAVVLLGSTLLGSVFQGGDLAGRWTGAWTLPGGGARDLVVSIEPAGEGRFAGTAVSLAGGMQSQPLPSLTVKGDVVRFEPMVGHERFQFRGKRSEDGQSLSGIVSGDTIETAGVFHLDRHPMVRAMPDHIVYGVDIPVSVDELVPLTVYLHRRGDDWLAEVDFPESGVLGYPVDVQGTDGVLMLTLPSPGKGDPVSLTMQPGEPTVTGLWGRGQRVRVVELERGRATPTPRPQVPAPPYPWHEYEVQIESAEAPSLSGVLATPLGRPPFPLAVLVGEAGTDRNSTIAEHPSLLVLTKALTEAGVATLRLDLDGADFVSRRRALRRWMEWVAVSPEIDHRLVALIGLGEGGSIAARHVAAFDEGVTALVLLSAPGLPGRIIESMRLRALLEQSGIEVGLLPGVISAHDAYLDLAIKNVHADALSASAKAWLGAQRAALGIAGSPPDRDVKAAVDQAMDPTWQYWLSFDPRMTMPRIRGVPTLAIQGDQDPTVDAAANLTALVDAARPRGVSIEPMLLTGLNHRLQPVGQRGGAAPARIRTTIAPSVLRAILEWLKPHLIRSSTPSPSIVPAP